MKNLGSNKISDRFYSIFSYLYISILALFCLYPLVLTLMVSISDEHLVQVEGYKLIPVKFSLDTYRYLIKLSGDKILNAYGITILVTIVGTLLAMFVTSMLAYAISVKAMKYRNMISLYCYFTVMFSAGIVPWYIICVRLLHLNNSIFALVIPYLVNVWSLFVLRNYFESVPDSLLESAKIDGASYVTIYSKIVMPLSKTALLTVGMLYGLQFWNDWWLAIMFISKRELFPLQYFLFSILSNTNALSTGLSKGVNISISLPTETVKMAITIVTIGPIIFLYPFVQKYFVKGIMVGAIKG